MKMIKKREKSVRSNPRLMSAVIVPVRTLVRFYNARILPTRSIDILYIILFSVSEFASEELFIAYLIETYTTHITSTSPAHTTMQSLVSLVVRYAQNRVDSSSEGVSPRYVPYNPQVAPQDYIRKHILTTNKLLQQKYKSASDIGNRIREYV